MHEHASHMHAKLDSSVGVLDCQIVDGAVDGNVLFVQNRILPPPDAV